MIEIIAELTPAEQDMVSFAILALIPTVTWIAYRLGHNDGFRIGYREGRVDHD